LAGQPSSSELGVEVEPGVRARRGHHGELGFEIGELRTVDLTHVKQVGAFPGDHSPSTTLKDSGCSEIFQPARSLPFKSSVKPSASALGASAKAPARVRARQRVRSFFMRATPSGTQSDGKIDFRFPSAPVRAKGQPGLTPDASDDITGIAPCRNSSAAGDELRMPNIDRLSREGLTFTNFYANSCVCSPTRAALLTGCYPDRVGVPGVIREETPAESWGYLAPKAILLLVLKAAGYHSGIVRKWHLGNRFAEYSHRARVRLLRWLPWRHDG